MKNRIQALMMARELESYQAVGTAKIANVICSLVTELELAEQELESLRETVRQMEFDLLEQKQ
jgi:hypothetical protein